MTNTGNPIIIPDDVEHRKKLESSAKSPNMLGDSKEVINNKNPETRIADTNTGARESSSGSGIATIEAAGDFQRPTPSELPHGGRALSAMRTTATDKTLGPSLSNNGAISTQSKSSKTSFVSQGKV
jgi:hypothetical protein